MKQNRFKSARDYSPSTSGSAPNTGAGRSVGPGRQRTKRDPPESTTRRHAAAPLEMRSTAATRSTPSSPVFPTDAMITPLKNSPNRYALAGLLVVLAAAATIFGSPAIAVDRYVDGNTVEPQQVTPPAAYCPGLPPQTPDGGGGGHMSSPLWTGKSESTRRTSPWSNAVTHNPESWQGPVPALLVEEPDSGSAATPDPLPPEASISCPENPGTLVAGRQTPAVGPAFLSAGTGRADQPNARPASCIESYGCGGHRPGRIRRMGGSGKTRVRARGAGPAGIVTVAR